MEVFLDICQTEFICLWSQSVFMYYCAVYAVPSLLKHFVEI